jgi:hypothetical protein
MIRFERRGITFGEVWFDEPVTQPTPDVLIIRHSRQRPAVGPSCAKLSLVTDLSVTGTDIWQSISRGSRRGIQRARETGFTIRRAHPVREDNEIAEFVIFYDGFAAAKHLRAVDARYLKAVQDSGRLWVSSISKGDEVLAWNTYIATGSIVRSSYGGSICHTVGPERRREVANAQRLLNWDDLESFKTAGFLTFDWGGIFADESLPDAKGINSFKREFGGVEVRYFETTRAMSLRGRMYLSLQPMVRNARNLIRAKQHGWSTDRIADGKIAVTQ